MRHAISSTWWMGPPILIQKGWNFRTFSLEPTRPDRSQALCAIRPEQRARNKQWAIPSWRAYQARDCGTAEIQRIAENAARWADVSKSIAPLA
jgi:hypothetical protein